PFPSVVAGPNDTPDGSRDVARENPSDAWAMPVRAVSLTDLTIADNNRQSAWLPGSDGFLLGGTITPEAIDLALSAVMVERPSGQDFTTQPTTLTNTGSGLSVSGKDDSFLLASGGQTDFNDASSNMLTDGAGSDSYFAGTADKI